MRLPVQDVLTISTGYLADISNNQPPWKRWSPRPKPSLLNLQRSSASSATQELATEPLWHSASLTYVPSPFVTWEWLGMGSEAASQRLEQPRGTLDLVEDEAIILVKAAPRRSDTFGETVCCAGLDNAGKWVRLYPVSFRQLEDAQRFRRWDRIRYRWSKPKATKDIREESRRVDPNSIEIEKPLRPADRNRLLSRCKVGGLKREREAGRSLALLVAEILEFWAVRHTEDELARRDGVLANLRAQDDLFKPAAQLIPMRTCPYSFHYRYRDDDGVHEGTCQDWETEQTYFARLRDLGSERAALDWVENKFGEEYPRRGMALAMGTHRYRADQWLINGVIRLDD